MWTFLYRAFWTAARAAAPLFASRDGKLGRSVSGRLEAARSLAAWAAANRDTSRRLVWFHAASGGEGRQAEAVLILLRAARPGWQIVFTHSSASAERLAAGLEVDYAGYLPADTVADARGALEAVRPDALIFAATDLWPELIRQARARGVRLGLISATLSPTSRFRGGLARAAFRETYAALDAVGAIDSPDAGALIALGVRPGVMTVTGDTRHDAAAARVAAIDQDQPALRALRALSAGNPLLVAGSTWPADEQELLPAIAEVRRRHALPMVIAPHEPDESHLIDLERRIAATLPGAGVMRLSRLEADPSKGPPVPRSPVVVVDRVGILAELYAAASLAFVGGGFHSAGLHSVIEPAALGVPVLFGPQWRSSRDARLLLETGGAVSAGDRGGLAAALTRWLDDPAARRGASDAARAVVSEGLGASDRSLELVIGLVDRKPSGAVVP